MFDNLIVVYSIIFLAVSIILVMVGVNSSRPLWTKITMIVLGLGLSPFAYFTYDNMSGIPRVVRSMEVFNVEPAPEVITYISMRGKYLLLLVKMPDKEKPTYFEIKWNEETAELIEEQFNESQEEGGRLEINVDKGDGTINSQINFEVSHLPSETELPKQ